MIKKQERKWPFGSVRILLSSWHKVDEGELSLKDLLHLNRLTVCAFWHYTRWSHVVRHLSSSRNQFRSEEEGSTTRHANIYRKSRMVLSTCALYAGCRDKPLKQGKMFWTHLLPSRMKEERLWLASRAPNWNSHHLLSSLRLCCESAARYVRH